MDPGRLEIIVPGLETSPEAEFFERCYGGALFLAAPRASLLALGQRAREVIEEEFGREPETLPPEEFREALGRSRERLAKKREQGLAESVLRDLGLAEETLCLDHLRLRAITPGLEQIPEAAPVFYAHRDTWYGNPRCQVNAWLPLHEVTSANGFRVYLDAFSRPVPNDSERFDLSRFQAEGGFGRLCDPTGSVYPQAREAHTWGTQTWDTVIGKDALLFFSGAHLHQTLPNTSSRTRFSVDFRFFHQRDLGHRGAPDPDNRSRGSAARFYRPFS